MLKVTIHNSIYTYTGWSLSLFIIIITTFEISPFMNIFIYIILNYDVSHLRFTISYDIMIKRWYLKKKNNNVECSIEVFFYFVKSSSEYFI